MQKKYVYFNEKYERKAERIIFVDGICPGALTSKDIELSHWMPNKTPLKHKKDTSTEICFSFLSEKDEKGFGQVSSNHFDTDGLLAAFTLMYPSVALKHRKLLERVSHMGDFGAWQEREFSIFYDVLASLRKRWKNEGLNSEQSFFKGFETLPYLVENYLEIDSENANKSFNFLEKQRSKVKSNEIKRIEIHPRLTVYRWSYDKAISLGLDPFYSVGFDSGLNTTTMLPNQLRNYFDRERLCLIVIEHKNGFFYDLLLPEYLWAETSTLWIPSGIVNEGKTNLFRWKCQTEDSTKTNLKRVCDNLNSKDTGLGKWVLCHEFNAFKTIPGKKFPVFMSYLKNDQAAPSKLSPENVIENLLSIEFI